MKTIYILIALTLLLSNKGESQTGWFPLTDTSSMIWQGIHFFDEQNGIAVGNPSLNYSPAIVISTQDGGLSWKTIPLPDSLFFSQRMLFTSRDTGFIVGGTYENQRYYTAIYRTIDGGKTWMKSMHNIMRGRIQSISSCGNGIIYVGGYYILETIKQSRYLLLKTTDYGESWNEVNAQFYDFNAKDTFSPKKDDIYSICFRDSLNGIVITLYDEYSIYFRTSDGGYNWYRMPQPLRQSGVGVYYLAADAWLMGAKFAIYRTTDNAMSWSEVGFPSGNAESFSFVNGNFGMSVPGYRMFQGGYEIQRTYDSGKTWEIADHGIPLNLKLGAISVVSPTVAYCAGVRGMIYKTIDGGGPANNPTGVIEFAEGRKSFSVFPNPTSSTLKLTYELSSQNQQLVVSDLLGNMVLEATLPAGTTETTLNFTELPTGTYFCRLGKESRAFVVVR